MSRKSRFGARLKDKHGLSIPKRGSHWLLRDNEDEIVVLPYKGTSVIYYYNLQSLAIYSIPLEDFYIAFTFKRNALPDEDYMAPIGSVSVDKSPIRKVAPVAPRSHQEVMNAVANARRAPRTFEQIKPKRRRHASKSVPIGTEGASK